MESGEEYQFAAADEGPILKIYWDPYNWSFQLECVLDYWRIDKLPWMFRYKNITWLWKMKLTPKLNYLIRAVSLNQFPNTPNKIAK